MSEESGATTREIRELQTELKRTTSALRLAIAWSVAVAVATPVMIMVSVSTFVRPSWMQGQATLVAFWAVLLGASVAVAWTVVALVRRRTSRLP